jgi:PAS domain S-box-containing protein
MDVLAWLKEKKTDILDNCLSAVRSQGLAALVGEGDAQIEGGLGSLCNAVMDAIEGQQVETSPELTAWAQRCREEQCASLADLLRILFVMRTAVQETILQSTDAAQANQAWQDLSPVFDQIAALLSDIYTQAMEQALTARLQESERLTSSLIQASEEADKALVQLHSIYDISQALGTSLSDTEEIFNRLAQKLGAALESSHCTIWLSDVGPPYAVATYISDEHTIGELPENVEESAFGQVLFSGEAQILVHEDDALPANRALLDSLCANKLLLAPFSVQEIPIGVVTVGRDDSDIAFDPTEITLVESVVTQAAIAVQNAGLYQEIRDLNRSLEARVASRTRELGREKERMETLYTVGQELGTSLDLDQVLEKTLQRIAQAVGAKQGSIMMLDENRTVLLYAARVTAGSPASNGNSAPFRASTGIPGWVIEHRKAVLIPDVAEDERWRPLDEDDPDTRSLIAAPLTVGDDIHGVLQVSATAAKAFDQDQQRLVVTSAQQIAQAMHNAKLYSREQKERSQTQAVLQSIADGVIVNDTADRVIVFNAAAEDILDTEQDAVLGDNVWRLFDVFDENGRSDALAAMEAISASPLSSVGQAIESTLEVQNKVVSAHMTPVVTENDEALGIVTALRDITREVEADRAKSEFVSTVSHELRTPLTSIKGYTDLIYAGAVGPVNDQQKRFLGIIKSNADRLTALINDLLDISRIESGRVKIKVESQQLIEIVHEVIESLHEQIEVKDLKLELQLPDGVPDIMGDRLRLNQIVTNLIGNAVKFTDEGWIRVSLCTLEGAVRLDVADSGIGISMEDQGKIFEKFYRADTPVMEGRGGTGLGLAITKELVELHGGRLWVKSEIDVGSTFTVVLPAAAQDLPASVLADLPAGAKKVLVVDDERDILALLRHQLAMQGYQVITAATGGKAITKAIDEQPDLITLDILLPDRHGFDVLRELKARPETAHIPVIVLSVVQDETSGYRLGAVDYIVKPLDEQRLLGSVAYILNRKGTVLIAEDTQDTADLLTELLTKHGYEALHAINGYETLAMARREHPDLILLDLRMPGMDGYEALTRLKKDTETRSIPILVMSAHAADAVQERLRLQAMGAEDFVSKPFSLEELIQEVERIAFSEGAQEPADESHGSSSRSDKPESQ